MAKDLLPGENLVLKAHPHWIVFLGSLVIPAVLLIVVAIADFTLLAGDNYVTSIRHLRTYLSLGVIALALLWFIVAYIRWQSTAYTLTDQRIKIESGVF